MLRKLVAAALILAACTSFGASAQEQPWPSRTVRIVVPYAAGGNSDVMARVIAQRLTDVFGQTFIVENRVGANGALAADTVIRSGADGYTLLWAVTPPMTIAPGDGQAQLRSDQGFRANQRGRDQRIRIGGQQGLSAQDPR
jgi:tripartite-type tricarboxylate transporter receptor subunit TctC